MTQSEAKRRYLETLDSGPEPTNARRVDALAEFVERICGEETENLRSRVAELEAEVAARTEDLIKFGGGVSRE